MKNSVKIQRIAIAGFVSFVIVLMFGSAIAAINYSWIWTSNVRFGLTSYGTSVGFDSNVYLESFVFDSGTSVDFVNVKMDSTNVAAITFSTQTANLTATQLDDSYVKYSVDGAGNQTIVYGTKVPASVYVDGVLRLAGTVWSQAGYTTTVTGAENTVILSYAPYYPPVDPTEGGFQDPLFQYLLSMDLVGFVFACYTSVIGPLAFGLPILFISAVLYIRQKSLFIVSMVWLLVGAGFISAMAELSPLAVVFTALGLAGVLVQLVLTWRKQ